MGNKQQTLTQSQKDEKPEQPEEPDSDFICDICYETFEANKKFNNRNICKHEFCCGCIARYVEAKVVQFNTANICCPALGCKVLLDPLSCRPIISGHLHLFEKWCDLLCSAAILEYYNKKTLYCPYRDCSALIVNECNDEPTKSSCPNCNKMFCFKCKSKWHAGFRCKEKGKFRDRNDVLAGQLIEDKKWARCSKCRHAVERNGGCTRIRCRCGHVFCYSCGETARYGRLCCERMGVSDLCCFIIVLTFLIFVIVHIMNTFRCR